MIKLDGKISAKYTDNNSKLIRNVDDFGKETDEDDRVNEITLLDIKQKQKTSFNNMKNGAGAFYKSNKNLDIPLHKVILTSKWFEKKEEEKKII